VDSSYDTLPETPDPLVVPLIHYGILGVNDFTDYESAYCLNGYYVNGTELNRAIQEFEPRSFRIELAAFRGPDGVRRVKVVDPEIYDQKREWLGDVHLRKLEVDPVIQAVGRVRFLTKPRQVVTFQMNNIERDLGPCETVRTLEGLRQALDLPKAREVDHLVAGIRARRLMDGEGLTAADAATRLGVSRRTAFRCLASEESAKSPLSVFLRLSGIKPRQEVRT
jgi:hypothetical protein